MRLPSHLLQKLCLAGLATAAACEPAHKDTDEHCANPTRAIAEEGPSDDGESLRDVVDVRDELPAAAPRFAVEPTPQPQQQHQPQPQKQPPPPPHIKPKPKRMVWASVCGHTELVPESSLMVRCGQG